VVRPEIYVSQARKIDESDQCQAFLLMLRAIIDFVDRFSMMTMTATR
jgi:hypothetical protein